MSAHLEQSQMKAQPHSGAGRRANSQRRLHPNSCDHVAWGGKWDFEDGIKVRTLEWGDYTVLP